MADLQYSSRTIKQWTCVRGQADTSEDVNSVTLEDYFHSMVSSIGVKSAGISRSRAFNEVMVEKMTMVRDSISSVSLDEEMTNLIKYEQGYAAAAKLISVADEMLTTLLSIK
jgi:flagellar hook-associated protein 1 FlgK